MRFLAAIAASLAAHAVLALALAWWLGASGDRELARLDLSSVELSFAEEEDDSAAAAPKARQGRRRKRVKREKMICLIFISLNYPFIF